MAVYSTDGARVFDAIEFAARAHRGQLRKGSNVPYIVHPLAVGKTLILHGCEEDVVIGGILHDTLEDTKTTYDDIERSFGRRVAGIVAAESESDKSLPWEQREHMKVATMDVLLIACADKLDNVRTTREDYLRVGDVVWSHFKRGRDSQAWYHRSLADVFASRVAGEPSTSLFGTYTGEVKEFFG